MNGVNLRGGKVIYDDFNIDFNLPLSLQSLLLDEDMLQIDYPNDYCVDLGRYGQLGSTGHFKIYAIKGCDWEDPILVREITADKVKSLHQQLNEVIEIVADLANKNESV